MKIIVPHWIEIHEDRKSQINPFVKNSFVSTAKIYEKIFDDSAFQSINFSILLLHSVNSTEFLCF